MTLTISVGSRVISSACWATYCSLHCTCGQSERTHTHTNKQISSVNTGNPLQNGNPAAVVAYSNVFPSTHPSPHIWLPLHPCLHCLDSGKLQPTCAFLTYAKRDQGYRRTTSVSSCLHLLSGNVKSDLWTCALTSNGKTYFTGRHVQCSK